MSSLDGILSWFSPQRAGVRKDHPMITSAATPLTIEDYPRHDSPPLKRPRLTAVDIVPQTPTNSDDCGRGSQCKDFTSSPTKSPTSNNDDDAEDNTPPSSTHQEKKSLILMVDHPESGFQYISTTYYPQRKYKRERKGAKLKPAEHSTTLSSAVMFPKKRQVTATKVKAQEDSLQELRDAQISRCLKPEPDSPLHLFGKTVEGVPISSSPIDLSLSSTEANLAVLNSIIRCRIASGASSTKFIFQGLFHNRLRQGYESLQRGKLTRGERDLLRTKLAGIWCLYAHFVCEYGKYKLSERKINSNDTDKSVSLADFYKHAICIMKAAASCPFVGTQVSMFLGRLLVAGKAWSEGMQVSSSDENSSPASYLFCHREEVRASCREAIDVCWGIMRHCQLVSLEAGGGAQFNHQVNKSSADHAINFFVHLSEAEEMARIDDLGIQSQCFRTSFSEILNLPSTLDRRKHGHFERDCSSIITICTELNRWSRLEEQLQKYPETLIHYFDPVGFLESLPLFRAPFPLAQNLDTTCDDSLVTDVSLFCRHCGNEFKKETSFSIHQSLCATISSRKDCSGGCTISDCLLWKWS